MSLSEDILYINCIGKQNAKSLAHLVKRMDDLFKTQWAPSGANRVDTNLTDLDFKLII